MAGSKDSTVGSGWKAELELLPAASEVEFLRWFYQNSDSSERDALKLRFMQEQQKAVPAIGLI